jgi:prenyltransferase beta subunit
MCLQFVPRCFDRDSGGFADRPGGQADVTATAVGLMAIVELKLAVEQYAAAVRYLGERAKTFEETRLAAAGLEAAGRRSPQADDWLRQVAKMRNPDGTFGRGDGAARDTGGAVVTILRLGGQVTNRDAAIRTLSTGQRRDGGWGKAGAAGSDLETTYRVMRCFVMLNEKPDVGRCQRFVARCRNGDGGYGVAPGQPSNVAATYFASVILHWLEEK